MDGHNSAAMGNAESPAVADLRLGNVESVCWDSGLDKGDSS